MKPPTKFESFLFLIPGFGTELSAFWRLAKILLKESFVNIKDAFQTTNDFGGCRLSRHSRKGCMKMPKMPEKIRLKRDLPIDKIHNCKAGNVYDIIDRHAQSGTKRTNKVEFIAESGERVCALLGEFEWITDIEE